MTDQKKYSSLRFFLAAIALLDSLYIISEPIYRKGLDFLFVVPLMFVFCILYFGKKIIPYHENGMGLKIYYLIVIVRFIVQPFLIVISKGRLNFRMPEAHSDSYPVAIFIYCLEIIIACYVINKWYPILTVRNKVRQLYKRPISLNKYGKTVLFIYLTFLLLRLGTWFPAMNILGLKTAQLDLVIVFEATIFNCLKVFLFIFLIVKSKRNEKDTFKFRFYFFLAIVFGLFNFITYFGSNRSFIYETAIATIATLLYVYPQYRKRVFAFSLPFAISIMFYSYVSKQFAEENVVNVINVNAETAISNIVEEYANGIWTVARTYQASLGLPIETSFEALIKDIVDGFSGLNDLPMFGSINESLMDLKSSSDIFKSTLSQEDDRGQMLSLSGGFLIVGGEVVGWIVLFIGNYLMIFLLVSMDVKSKEVKDVYYRYMYIWMAILMGLVHCYCLQTIIFCWSKFILFYWIVLFINGYFGQRYFNHAMSRKKGFPADVKKIY